MDGGGFLQEAILWLLIWGFVLRWLVFRLLLIGLDSDLKRLLDRLPEGIFFATSQTVADTRSEWLMLDGQETTAQDTDWSVPIFFYPDGTTSTASLVLSNRRNRSITIELRGLTGVARVGPLLAPQEALQ